MEPRTPCDALAAGGKEVPYKFTGALIESVKHGAHHSVSEGAIRTEELIDQSSGSNIKQIHDQKSFEGWRKAG